MAKKATGEWQHLGETGKGSGGDYDGSILNHWRDPATGTEYVCLDGTDGGSGPSDGSPQWYKIDGVTLKKLSGQPQGFKPPAKKKK
ncbi:MAG: hypothetical protein K2Y21_03740 [Phycisphaerales bacterium]|nr:hypothetical protein [Phycisphaerales bacterium]